MARVNQYPKVTATRLSEEDAHKLEQLAASLHRTPSDTLRELVRLAEPTQLVPIRFVAAGELEHE